MFFSAMCYGWVADRFTPRCCCRFRYRHRASVWYAQTFIESAINYLRRLGCHHGPYFLVCALKGVALLAPGHLQARYFGLLRQAGLFEALLASIAVAWFARIIIFDASDKSAMVQVIYFQQCLLSDRTIAVVDFG